MTELAHIRARWWQWPTILSLDAPAVAITWQWLFAAVTGVAIRWPETFVLGTSVWLAYAADRWFEGWRLSPSVIRTQRHRFYHDHRLAVAIVWIAVVVADLAVAFAELSRRELAAGAVLLGPTLAYVVSHQWVHRDRRWRPPKEIVIALLLAGGSCVFIAPVPGVSWWILLPPVGLFAALCFANVLLIAAWEQEVDQSHGQDSLVRQFPSVVTIARVFPLILTGVAAAAGYARDFDPVAAHCLAASAILLALVDRIEPRIGWRAARVLADFVLLTPLVPLLRGLHG